MTKVILSIVGIVIVLFALAFTLESVGIGWQSYFGAKKENVNTKVFK